MPKAGGYAIHSANGPYSMHDPRQNRLLAALPPEELERVSRYLELVSMPLGQVLHESGDKMRHGYFPTTAIVSRLNVLEDGASAEIAVVGNEGMVGIPLFTGGETATSRAVVESAGHAYRLPYQLLEQERDRLDDLSRLLLRYTLALLTQIAQTAACNRHHSLEQQLCRCLLARLDRTSSTDLVLTQEQVAGILGVRREGVTEAAGHLRKVGLIAYRRGHISVLDRAGLMARSCECYAVVKKEFDRLLPPAITPEPTHHPMELAHHRGGFPQCAQR